MLQKLLLFEEFIVGLIMHKKNQKLSLSKLVWKQIKKHNPPSLKIKLNKIEYAYGMTDNTYIYLV